MKKWWDIKKPESLQRYQMRRWLSHVPHGCIVNGVAYLVVYNREAPERSYVICEGL